jgi:hypothetical protein
VRADSSQDVADVIAHGVDAEMQLGGDLSGRAAALEQI